MHKVNKTYGVVVYIGADTGMLISDTVYIYIFAVCVEEGHGSQSQRLSKSPRTQHQLM